MGSRARLASPAWSVQPASPATVGVSNSARTGTSTPIADRTRLISRVASSECPPSSKKLSSIPTRSTFSTSAKRTARSSSRGLRGRRPSAAPDSVGAGRALRSSLPFEVSGSRSSVTKEAGTMWAGSTSTTCLRTRAVSPPTTYAVSRGSPGWSSRTITAACVTSGASRTADSISPSSIRKPRIFTWSSARPK